MAFFSEEQWLLWADSLADNEFVVVDDFLTKEMYENIQAHFLEKLNSSVFEKAGIGALGDNVIKKEIRGDFTYWLDKDLDKPFQPFLELVDEMSLSFRRNCFLPITDSEFHYAFYPSGTHYAAHIDQFNKRSNRLISIVIYFNDNWKLGDGGELEIFNDNGKSILIDPIAKRCVIFRSDSVLHQVSKTSQDRYSLSGWLLKKPVGIGFLK